MHCTDDVINMDGTDQEFKFVRECITDQCNLNGNKMHWEITLHPPPPLQVKDFLPQICSDKMSENVTPDLFRMVPSSLHIQYLEKTIKKTYLWCELSAGPLCLSAQPPQPLGPSPDFL